ncbi:MAG: hypothetical protein P8N76_13450 [Pirellulaceae bacterium]|nr:hypothetical protein [Pirellulaceae bacterium]
MNVYLLGSVDFCRCLALQERLVYESGERSSERVSLLICEHPAVISIGRCGSRGHVGFSDRELESRRIPIRWVGRGGGAVLHAPGQLAVYPIVSLDRSIWSVGEYLRRFRSGVIEACRMAGLSTRVGENLTVWGRTGALGTIGVAIRYGVTMHGLWLNLNPDMYLTKRIDSLAYLQAGRATDAGKPHLSSLLSETGRPAKMARVRAAFLDALPTAFSAEKVHVHTGHPLLQTDSSNK